MNVCVLTFISFTLFFLCVCIRIHSVPASLDGDDFILSVCNILIKLLELLSIYLKMSANYGCMFLSDVTDVTYVTYHRSAQRGQMDLIWKRNQTYQMKEMSL